jgi:hypothetical protein
VEVEELDLLVKVELVSKEAVEPFFQKVVLDLHHPLGVEVLHQISFGEVQEVVLHQTSFGEVQVVVLHQISFGEVQVEEVLHQTSMEEVQEEHLHVKLEVEEEDQD